MAMETWSSWLAEVKVESTEAGCDLCVFSLISAAAVHPQATKPTRFHAVTRKAASALCLRCQRSDLFLTLAPSLPAFSPPQFLALDAAYVVMLSPCHPR
jgi:hypothetical protein